VNSFVLHVLFIGLLRCSEVQCSCSDSAHLCHLLIQLSALCCVTRWRVRWQTQLQAVQANIEAAWQESCKQCSEFVEAERRRETWTAGMHVPLHVRRTFLFFAYQQFCDHFRIWTDFVCCHMNCKKTSLNSWCSTRTVNALRVCRVYPLKLQAASVHSSVGLCSSHVAWEVKLTAVCRFFFPSMSWAARLVCCGNE